jgi:hypothetical protein
MGEGMTEQQPEYPDIDVCSQCKDNAVFDFDEFEGEWISVCCGAYAVQPDDYPEDLDDYLTQMHSDEPDPDEEELWT